MNTRRLVAMENAFPDRRLISWDQRCEIIAKAGYKSVYVVPYPLEDEEFERLRNLTKAPSSHGLAVSAVYANIDLALTPDDSRSLRFWRLLDETSGSPRIELSFKNAGAPLHKNKVDELIHRLLDRVLPVAERRDFDVAIYPHSFYVLETIAHAIELIDTRAQARLGLIFPTSHVYAISSEANTLATLSKCVNRISSFNICGCVRSDPPPARCQHHPAGEGDLDLRPLLDTIKQSNYTGDLIVQGHGWACDPLDGLCRSANFLSTSF